MVPVRLLDPQQFFRVFQYALQGRDVRSALNGQSPAQAALLDDAGHIPVLDLAAVSKIIDVLLRDIAPLSLVLATRAGEVLAFAGYLSAAGPVITYPRDAEAA